MADLPFQDPDLPLDARVADLVSRLTLAEKAAQLLHEAPAVPRLGLPAYNWWNEALHGVARAGVATVFPQAIGLAAMWDVPTHHRVAEAISTEARAKHHEYVRKGDRGLYKGLTFWSPNINLLRDPRWGRAQETYGECPYLTARLGVAFVRGLQGDDARYLKTVATPKHFAVHSGPELLRHGFDAVVSEKDLRESYLPAFEAAVVEGRAESVMAAYNRVNGEACAASERLLGQILRGEWGFGGYVVSDCWAISDLHAHHKLTPGPEASAALALAAGCDLNCGCTYQHLPAAIAAGLVSEAELDRALARLLRARFRLGLLDPPERVPYASIPYEANDGSVHRALAWDAAVRGMVLLKNSDGLLPLRRDLRNIAVIGPNANDPAVLLGNYAGETSHAVTPLDGVRAAVSDRTRVWYAQGCKRTGLATDGLRRDGNLSEALSAAERADAVVLVLGLGADIEGEEGDAGGGVAHPEDVGDRADLALPGLQQRLLEEVAALGKPTVLVVIAGSPVDLSWAAEHPSVGAILMAWYPGEEAGNALADTLFGAISPGGRLPVTFPRALADLPDFHSYAMKGRTYRYLEHEPLYPFGYGLSYARFRYTSLQISSPQIRLGDRVWVSATVTNTSPVAGDEVVQLYVRDLEASVPVPHHSLRGFTRLSLAPGASRRVTYELEADDLALVDEEGRRGVEPGRFRLFLGGSQPDARSVALTGQAPLSVELEVVE